MAARMRIFRAGGRAKVPAGCMPIYADSRRASLAGRPWRTRRPGGLAPLKWPISSAPRPHESSGMGAVPVKTVHEWLGQTPHQQEQDYEATREIPAGTFPARQRRREPNGQGRQHAQYMPVPARMKKVNENQSEGDGEAINHIHQHSRHGPLLLVF